MARLVRLTKNTIGWESWCSSAWDSSFNLIWYMHTETDWLKYIITSVDYFEDYCPSSKIKCIYYLDPGPILLAAPIWLKLLNTGGPLFWETPNGELFFTSGKEATVGKLGVCDTDRCGLFRKLLNSVSFAFCKFLSPSTWGKETNELEFILDKNPSKIIFMMTKLYSMSVYNRN